MLTRPLGVSIAAMLMLGGAVQAQSDLSAELAEAQAALATADYDKAYPIYLSAAEGGNALAQFSVAMFHEAGWGTVQESPAVACDWYRRAAEGSIPAAAHFHARCLDEGIAGPADPKGAAHWYGRAAELGHYLSWCDLAELYMRGRGVPKDPARGLVLCRQAAELGAVPASLRTGRYLLQGDAAIRDPAAARAWFESVAHLPEAQYYLGLMHRDGLAGEASPKQARLWFERAASQGYVAAYLPTAQLYFAVSPDLRTHKPPADILAKAYMWLSASIERVAGPREKAQAQAMRDKVLAIMPPSWTPTLDQRVAQHLSEHPPLR
jgi:hypothetical protein